jgi:shikimate kinase
MQRKAQELKQEIEGTCIFLIGMMGSGKSTVGRLLAEALEYQFLDSDTVIESYAGGLSVPEIFKKWKEERFRELESQALQELSSAGEVVVATGGGAVVQPRNWVYLRNGITVWLDVPVPALASRVTAVGTGSRPLLGGDCGGYDQALARLSKIYEERGPAYANADVTVSLQNLALSLACEDISELTPTAITVQVKLVSPSITGEGNTCNAICSIYGSLQGAIKLLLKHLACWI